MPADDAIQKCWFLAGPTACGKSAVALELANRINAEIIALDSMSLYRGMDIGTAKPSPADRQRVPHHLIDILDPHEEYSVAEYVNRARSVAEEIVSRSKTPLFVGGTGLYLRGLLRGVFEGPAADWEFRKDLEQQAAQQGADWLHRQLQQVDPKSAALLHPNDLRRVIRALEVHHLTGRPLSTHHAETVRPPEERPAHVYWLSPPRDWLHERINQRVDRMIEQGLIDEVRRLQTLQPPLGRTARQALGYKELLDAFEEGGNTSDAIEQIKRRTRQFAKRQHTWFRNLPECQAIEISPESTPETIASELAARDSNV